MRSKVVQLGIISISKLIKKRKRTSMWASKEDNDWLKAERKRRQPTAEDEPRSASM